MSPQWPTYYLSMTCVTMIKVVIQYVRTLESQGTILFLLDSLRIRCVLNYYFRSFPSYEGKIGADELPSFHGTMSGYEAEARLREQESNCCYLTRYSESREELTLSVMRRKDDDYIFQNFDIVGEPEESPTSYEIFGTDEKFDSIVNLLDFYKENPLNHNIDSIGDAISKEMVANANDSLGASGSTGAEKSK